MKLFKCVFAAASLFISASALADDICVKQPSDGALYQCTVQQKKLAEEELNREYQTAKKRIFQLYGAQKKVADEYVAVMVDTQRNWLKYRDGQCRLEALPLKRIVMLMRWQPTSVLSVLTKGVLTFSGNCLTEWVPENEHDTFF